MHQVIRRGLRTVMSVLFVALLVGSPVAAQEGTGAFVDKTGWWNQANPGVDSPAGFQNVPAPPNIPQNGIAVSVTGNQNDKNAAVGIKPEADVGDTVTRFVLTLAEVEDEGANIRADSDDAVVVACPITDFWAETRNGRASDQPAADCGAASVTGKRSGEGVWTFDLLPIGELWLDSFSTITPDGVLLTVGEDAGNGFQVVFDVTSIEVVFEFTEGADDDAPFALPDSDEAGPTGDFGTGGGQVSTFNPSGGGGGGGGDFSSGGSVDIDDSPAPEPTETTEPPAPTDDGSQELAGTPVSNARPGFLEGIPGGGAFLLLLFAGLLYAMTFALGSAGDPAAETSRQRGVSRALAARERANDLDLEN